MSENHSTIDSALGRAYHRALTSLTAKGLNGNSEQLGVHLRRALGAEGLEVHTVDDTVRLPILRPSDVERFNGA